MPLNSRLIRNSAIDVFLDSDFEDDDGGDEVVAAVVVVDDVFDEVELCRLFASAAAGDFDRSTALST